MCESFLVFVELLVSKPTRITHRMDRRTYEVQRTIRGLPIGGSITRITVVNPLEGGALRCSLMTAMHQRSQAIVDELRQSAGAG